MTFNVISGERRHALEDVQARGMRAASGYAAMGVGENDSVALLLRNDIAYFEATIATMPVGAYAVPVNWHFKSEEVRYILENSDAKVVVAHADLVAKLHDWCPEHVEVLIVPTPTEIAAAYNIAPEICAVPAGQVNWNDWVDGQSIYDKEAVDSRSSMIYTSGTTGQPKGVRREPMSPEQQQKSAVIGLRGFGLEPGMVAAMTGPMYHSAPNGYARASISLGCDMILLPRFDPEELLAAIDKYKISHMHVVPTMFVRLLRLPDEVKEKYDVSSLKFVVHGAAPCPVDVKLKMLDWWGPVIYEYYGSTEAGLVTRGEPEDYRAKPGTVGKPHPGTDVRIFDDNGNSLPANEIGEIYMGLNALSDFTYHKNDEKRAEIGRDNFVTNGDVGFIDDDGYLFLCDRKRDMIISGGVNIYPAEIEGILVDAPGVLDCAVFGIPDDDFGEAIAAAVQPQPGQEPSEADIVAYMKEHLASYKLPRVITFHKDLPREDTGKIFKRHLRDPYWEKAGRQI